MSIENPAPAHPPQDAPESRSTAERGGGNTRRSAAGSPTGDRITVQRVTSTVAGEYREWTVTVRLSSPAGVGDPLNAMTPGARQLLPDAVRAALGDWLEGRPLVADGAPLLVGRDFQVGDRKPLFPITEPEPAAPYAGRTAPRRTPPPSAPVRLWNRDYTDHLDVIGRALTAPGKTKVRVRDDQADDARAWIAERFGADENVHVAWMDRPWSVAEYYAAGRRGGLTLVLEPMPKPPRVDQVLARPGGRGPVPPFSGKTTPPADAPYAGPFPHLQAGDRIGVEHPDTGEVTIHEFSGDPKHPDADTPEPDVDEVLPMPGGPNDRLAQAARPTLCVQRRRPNGLPCLRAAGHTGQHRDYTGTTWTTPSPYADLYARLDAIHDATAEEDQ